MINILEIQRKSIESSLTQLENSPECSEKFSRENSYEEKYEEKKDLDLSEKKYKKEYERLKKAIDAVVMAEYKSEDEFDKAVGAVLNSSEYVMDGEAKNNKELDCSGFIGKVYDELSSENLNDKVKGYNEEKCNKGDKSYCCLDKAMPCIKRSQKQYEYLSREGKIVDDITQIKPMSVLYFEEVVGKEKNKEKKEIVHTLLFEYYGKKGEPVEEKSIPLKNGCYSYCPTKRIKGKCPVSEKEQCFVGGGIP